MKKSFIYVIGVLIIVSIFGIDYILTKKEIVKYQLKTSEYFSDLPYYDQYYIDSVEELNYFYELYSDALNIDESVLKNKNIFIKVKEVSSGSIKYDFKDIEIYNDNIYFDLDTKTPEIGTDDMAFWYFVAYIPKYKTLGIDFYDWIKPSELFLDEDDFVVDNKSKFQIFTDYKWKTMMNDGGSHTDIYYNIDFDNNTITKVRKDYSANLGGKSSIDVEIVYTADLTYRYKNNLSNLINETKYSNLIDNGNYSYYTLVGYDFTYNIYNRNIIEKYRNLLEEIDEINE